MGPSGERGEDWFTDLYATHYQDIVRYGLRRTAGMDDSVEVAQEVFVVAWQRRVDVPQHGLPWLYGVARRVLANRWRSRRGRPIVTSMIDLPQHQADTQNPESAGDLLDLINALHSLSETDQEILRLIGWEELTLAEAAVVLSCSRPTAGVRLHRARWRLRNAMGTTSSVKNTQIPGGKNDEHAAAATGPSRSG
ncbi:RNA polymerase sigma factor [Micromonospora sp. NPDC048871]|uniref:RNA polymerase sigma factor n=1 Tax=Micromonospora sp. NPDC048871 TaxID=3364259 RepID=UPI00371223BE